MYGMSIMEHFFKVVWQPSPNNSPQQHPYQERWLEADETGTDGEADAAIQPEAAAE
jgi:hypothetical protein